MSHTFQLLFYRILLYIRALKYKKLPSVLAKIKLTLLLFSGWKSFLLTSSDRAIKYAIVKVEARKTIT